MQDKRSDGFDLRLRSMLEDAEVRPSRRVWRGISARLDAAAAPAAGPWSRMKWAGLALAAAAVAAAVFFSGTGNSIPTIIHNQEQAMLAQAGWPAGAPTEVAAPADVPAAKTEETAVRRTAASPVANPIPEAAEPVADAPAPESAAPAAARPAAEPERKAPARDEVRNADFVPDPFAGPEPAGRRRAARPGVSLYAQGMVGSNDSDFRTAPVSMMSPGQAGGFSELGASTYRIPFTLGIGARFYLGPRLSLGTGLD